MSVKNHGTRLKLQQFNPTLTYHALIRISQRLCNETEEECIITILGQKVRARRKVRWIQPNFLKRIIGDVRSSIYNQCYFSDSRGLITQGKLAFYVVAQDHSIITVITDLKKETKRELIETGEKLDYRWRIQYLGIK